jgi:hypothetical protein
VARSLAPRAGAIAASCRNACLRCRTRGRRSDRHPAGRRDWTSHEVTARVPGDANVVMFGIFLAGRGRIELRHAEVTRSA